MLPNPKSIQNQCHAICSMMKYSGSGIVHKKKIRKVFGKYLRYTCIKKITVVFRIFQCLHRNNMIDKYENI